MRGVQERTVVVNNLNNIANSKASPKEWNDIIKTDKTIANKVMNLMVKLGILEISQGFKDVKILYHKLEEIEGTHYSEEEFKLKVIELICRID